MLWILRILRWECCLRSLALGRAVVITVAVEGTISGNRPGETASSRPSPDPRRRRRTPSYRRNRSRHAPHNWMPWSSLLTARRHIGRSRTNFSAPPVIPSSLRFQRRGPVHAAACGDASGHGISRSGRLTPSSWPRWWQRLPQTSPVFLTLKSFHDSLSEAWKFVGRNRALLS